MKDMDQTGHLAWCALIALHTARQDGVVNSETQENLFITRWFSQAKKERRFVRDVATDIDWLLKQGRTLGIRARLRSKLDYLWRSCNGVLSEQNDLFRLTYAIEMATQYGWVYKLLEDKHWRGRKQIKVNQEVNSKLILKSGLDAGFCQSGNQLLPVPAKICGESKDLNALLRSYGWEAANHGDSWYLLARRSIAD